MLIFSGLLSNLIFINETTGYYHVGNKLYITFDSGYNWTLQYEDIPYSNELNLSFVNESIGYIQVQEELLKTIDSGVTWTLQNSNLEFTPSEHSELIFID